MTLLSIGLYRNYSLLLIYGIKKLKLAWDLHQKKQVGLWLERFDPEYSPLIPDPSLKALSVGDNTRGTWIWDQSLLTVEINTITRVYTPGYLYVMQWEAS